MANPKRFTPKSKSVTYTGVFVELYNWRNGGQVHEIHGMIEFEKMRALTAENLHNLSAHRIIEILSVLCSTHVAPRDQNKFMFYVNNYIDWDWFNHLYDSNWMKKGIRNADVVARKLRLASTKATNDRLEAAREKRWKKEEMMERQKAKVMAAKRRRTRGGISLSSEKEDGSDSRDNTDADQANDKYLLQL